MMTKTNTQRRLRSFEALQIALATEDARHMPTTAEIERQVESLYAAGRRRLAQIRYAENARWPVTIVTSEIRPSVIAMSRDEVTSQLVAIHVRNPDMHVAHRDLETLSEHDLRSMLEDALRLVEDKE